MIKIVTDEHYPLISSLFEESTESIRIISPFLSRKMAVLLCKAARKGVDCCFITRFYLQDFLDGSNSLEGLQDMKDAGVNVYALIGLHTKLYLFDDSDAIVGSANFTEGGLVRNIELSIYLNGEPAIDTLLDYYEDIVNKIIKAEDGLITQEMLDDYKERYKKQKKSKSKLDGGKHILTTIRGAVLDRNARNIKNDNDQLFEEIETNAGERLSDPVYAALGGKKESASYKSLRNIILKFYASSKKRADADKLMPMPAFKDDEKTIYISNFSAARKKSAMTVEEGDETFFCVHSYDKSGNPCPLIVGKGYFRKYNQNNDARLKGWINEYDWLAEYPIYCVISEAKIINAPVKNGIPLREMVEALGYKTYMHTRDNPEKYTKERVAKAHGQQAMLALSPEAKEYLDERLEELGKQYGWKEYKSEH